MTNLRKAIIATITYADIFDYPLTVQEVFRFLISPTKSNKKTVQKMLSLMSTDLKLIYTDNVYYCLGGRQNIIYIRDERKQWSKKKLKIARRVAQWLRMIPWIKMVGITGALAMGNTDKDDDIDILIVCSQGRLWLTRLLAVLLIELLGKRRRPGDSQVKDKICLNMFLDEAHLAVPEKERDMFSAHEVCQMRPLWEKDGIYQRFLKENQWVRKYLPNALHTTHNMQPITLNTNQHKMFHVSCYMLHALENLSKTLQLWYMRKRRTTEIISEGVLRFHLQDAREWVLAEYKKRLIN